MELGSQIQSIRCGFQLPLLLGEYIPQAPVNDEAKQNNQNLPGMGGIFNPTNTNLWEEKDFQLILA